MASRVLPKAFTEWDYPEAMDQVHSSNRHRSDSWKGWLVFAGFLAIIGYLLAGEHRVHVLTALPFLFFLSCPLMHLFMHGGHGRDMGSAKQ